FYDSYPDAGTLNDPWHRRPLLFRLGTGTAEMEIRSGGGTHIGRIKGFL
ncbi:hypothetical protein CLOSTHATH_07597, partial [Hungatella hathewayi DSM 13479]